LDRLTFIHFLREIAAVMQSASGRSDVGRKGFCLQKFPLNKVIKGRYWCDIDIGTRIPSAGDSAEQKWKRKIE
jgi:hypothetical protein